MFPPIQCSGPLHHSHSDIRSSPRPTPTRHMTSPAAEKRAADALGAKSARACDSCMQRRVRWYCAADDAFLCQSCDASVHSANPLASRHERVRLKNTSSSSTLLSLELLSGGKGEPLPAWVNGFRRKARTPRQHKPGSGGYMSGSTNLVPDLASSEDHSADDSDDQLLYRVPIFDPIVANFCSSSSAASAAPPSAADNESKPVPAGPSSSMAQAADTISGFLPTEAELADFAADVESLLGNELYEESAFCMEGLGLLEESRHGDNMECFFYSGGGGRVKVEEDVAEGGARARTSTSQVMDAELDLSRDTLELSLDYDSPTTGGEEEDAAEEEKASVAINGGCRTEERTRIALRLNYKAVIAAWDCQSSPWSTGYRPQFNPNDPWPECIVGCASELHLYGGEMGSSLGGQAAGGDGGREARVSRYREKRRTRLFSKKIRYEVRKLNAEKRPRMKGRFVKRTSFAAQGFAY